MTRIWAFSFFWGTSETTGVGVGAEAGTQAFRTALKILYKSFLEYLRILVSTTGALATGSFVSKGPAGWLDNSSPDLGVGEESGGATKGRLQQGRPQPSIEVFLELISSKNTFSNGLADPLGMEKLEF